MTTLDLSTAVSLYNTTSVTGASLAPLAPSTYIEVIFPSLVLAQRSTYRIEVDYTNGGTTPKVDLYSSLGPTEAAADLSGWWTMGALTGTGAAGTMVKEISGFSDPTSGSDWFRAFRNTPTIDPGVEPYVIFDGSVGLVVTGVRIFDITPAPHPFETEVLADNPTLFYRFKETRAAPPATWVGGRYAYDHSGSHHWGENFYNSINVYPGWPVEDSEEDATSVRLNGRGYVVVGSDELGAPYWYDDFVGGITMEFVLTQATVGPTDPHFLMSRGTDIMALSVTTTGGLDLMWGEILGGGAPYYSPKHYLSAPGVVQVGVKQHIAVKVSASLNEVKFLIDGVVVTTLSGAVDEHPAAGIQKINLFINSVLGADGFMGRAHEAVFFNEYVSDARIAAHAAALGLGVVTTADVPVTNFVPLDPATYPWDNLGGTGPNDWSPPQTEGILTNWGYIVPDYTALATPGLGTQYDAASFKAERSHAAFGADFDPRRSIEFSLSDPGTYGPPIGTIEADDSITFFGDPFVPGVSQHWDMTTPDIVTATFGNGTVPAGASIEGARLVAQGYPGGGTPRLWIMWQTGGGVHRAAYIDLGNYGDFNYDEYLDTRLPADFPITSALAGDPFRMVFTISGGLYYGEFTYIALRLDLGAEEIPPTRPHYLRTIRSDAGDVLRNCTIEVRDPGTTTLISEEVFASASGGFIRGSWWYAPDGVADFYLNVPQVVDILITPIDPGYTPILWANQWVGDRENVTGEGLSLTGSATGYIPVANGAGGWAWGPADSGVSSVNSLTGNLTFDAPDLNAISTSGFARMRVLTQAAYDALSPKVATTLYLIRGEAL